MKLVATGIAIFGLMGTTLPAAANEELAKKRLRSSERCG